MVPLSVSGVDAERPPGSAALDVVPAVGGEDRGLWIPGPRGRPPAERCRPRGPSTEPGERASPRAAPAGNSRWTPRATSCRCRQILVSPKVNGMILKSYILEGKHVKKGDVLAGVRRRRLPGRLPAGQATLELARHRLSEIETSRPKEIGAPRRSLRRPRPSWSSEIGLRAEQGPVQEQDSVSKQDFELAESKHLAQEQRVKRLRIRAEADGKLADRSGSPRPRPKSARPRPSWPRPSGGWTTA